MSRRLIHEVPLRDPEAQRRIVPVRDERSVAIAQALDWPGLLFEAGRNDIAVLDDLTLAHHYLAVNMGKEPLVIEMKGARGYRPITLEPCSGGFMPAGQSISLRVRNASTHDYVRISIDPLRLDRLVNASGEGAAPIRLRHTFDIRGSQMRHVLGALTAEASSGTPGGLAFVDTLLMALGQLIVRHAGEIAPPSLRERGGLAPGVRRRVLELMEGQTDSRLTVDSLAREAGLSVPHFARAFKESIGRAPHQHLLMLRLERARRLLDSPRATLSAVALQAGFADQAHFTRHFKRHFGVTPGAFVRSQR